MNAMIASSFLACGWKPHYLNLPRAEPDSVPIIGNLSDKLEFFSGRLLSARRVAMKTMLIIGALSAFSFLSASYAAETTAPVTNEKETGSSAAAPSPNDTVKAGMDPACKAILAHQSEHSKQEVAKCGKPSE